jgi:amino acid transporter
LSIFAYGRSFFRAFVGYSNANYALSEVCDPVRTIKRAAPLAMLAVSFIYMLVNIAYFGVVSKADILGSRRIVAYGMSELIAYHRLIFHSESSALFFRNLFGTATEKAGLVIGIRSA